MCPFFIVLSIICIYYACYEDRIQPIVDNGKLAEGDGIGDGVGAIRVRVAASDPIHLSS